ncbi:MAG TPA: transketolase [Anaerolinea sp.]|nr:transketolase [Anaerolinea sp.]
MDETTQLQSAAINTIRFLSADAVQKAKSGHPGLPMGAAAMAYTIWTRHLRHNPANPAWPNRDRFVLSGGHGSMLLYSLLYLTGYDVPMEQIQQFRQWGSITPGHPEYGLTPGVETTTGPLGQGFANGVGMAIAETHLASVFNRPGHEVIDHYTYAIVTDGDLMEGVSAEAASLAGHLQLGKLIYLYDDNRISIEGSTELAFTEDRAERFEAYGWHVQRVADGNDVDAIDRAIQLAKKDPRPSLIVCHTHIGFGLPTRQDTNKAHGEPPGDEELDGAKRNLGWPVEPRFFVPEDALAFFREAVSRGGALEEAWNQRIDAYRKVHPPLAEELQRRMSGEMPAGWEAALPTFDADPKGMATRASSGRTINAIAPLIPELMGGSADLAPSTDTWMKDFPAFAVDCREGRNLHFGVREHAMGAIVNGMFYHGGLIPFGATFLVFSDYMRPPIRLSALSHLAPIWVYTHDSVGVGEDGPTHQPVEHLVSLRAIPNLTVIRPGDANEVAQSWRLALKNRHGPTLLALSRQPVPTLDRSVFASAAGLEMGAYVLADLGGGVPQVILMASGTELSLIVEAGQRLAAEGIKVRLVSFPSWELFDKQDESYRAGVLPDSIPLRVSIEAGVTMGWVKYTGPKGINIGIDHFGASAPMKVIYEKFGLTPEAIIQSVHQLLGK